MDQSNYHPDTDPILRKYYDTIMSVTTEIITSIDKYELTDSCAHEIASLGAYVIQYLHDYIKEGFETHRETPEQLQSVARNVCEHWSYLVTYWAAWRPTVETELNVTPKDYPQYITADMFGVNARDDLTYTACTGQPSFVYYAICDKLRPKPSNMVRERRRTVTYDLRHASSRKAVAWRIVEANWFNDVRWYVPDYSSADNGKAAYEATYGVGN